MKLSVITCTHNPDLSLLKRVFEGLNGQSLPKDEWNYVVVDNNSDPVLAGQIDLSWHPSARVVTETKQGLTPSRFRGVSETEGGLVVFVDDDNILDPAYLETAVALMDQHPFIGILGGRGRGEYERNPEPWMTDFLPLIGVHEHDQARDMALQYAMSHQLGPCAPIGAGMVLRRELAEKHASMLEENPDREILDRTGSKSLLGGGDTDLIFSAVDMGWACGTSSKLTFIHVIPAWRLELNYLRRLLYSANYGTARILIAHGWKKQTGEEPPAFTQRVKKWLKFWHQLTPEEICRQAFSKGYRDGLAGKPYDISFL